MTICQFSANVIEVLFSIIRHVVGFRRNRLERELAADAAVTEFSMNRNRYASALANLKRSSQQTSAALATAADGGI